MISILIAYLYYILTFKLSITKIMYTFLFRFVFTVRVECSYLIFVDQCTLFIDDTSTVCYSLFYLCPNVRLIICALALPGTLLISKTILNGFNSEKRYALIRPFPESLRQRVIWIGNGCFFFNFRTFVP